MPRRGDASRGRASREPRLEPLPSTSPRVARPRRERVLRLPPSRDVGAASRGERRRHGPHGLVKSLSFQLPVLDAIARDPKTRRSTSTDEGSLAGSAALAHRASAKCLGRRLHETPGERSGRSAVVELVLPPPTASIGVLPHHDRCGDVLANLRHVCRRGHGTAASRSHVANVCVRLGGWRGSTTPSRISSSLATRERGRARVRLTGKPATVVFRTALPRPTRGVTGPAVLASARVARKRPRRVPAPLALTYAVAVRLLREEQRRLPTIPARVRGVDTSPQSLSPYRAATVRERRRSSVASSRASSGRTAYRCARSRDRHRAPDCAIRSASRPVCIAPTEVGRADAATAASRSRVHRDALAQFFALSPTRSLRKSRRRSSTTLTRGFSTPPSCPPHSKRRRDGDTSARERGSQRAP